VGDKAGGSIPDAAPESLIGQYIMRYLGLQVHLLSVIAITLSSKRDIVGI
jgi:hypothetical protein